MLYACVSYGHNELQVEILISETGAPNHTQIRTNALAWHVVEAGTPDLSLADKAMIDIGPNTSPHDAYNDAGRLPHNPKADSGIDGGVPC